MAAEFTPKQQALSLQRLCIINIVSRVEQYSEEYLSLLPSKMRNVILKSLPVVDVCRLERTSFVNGLDTAALWKDLYERHYSRYIRPQTDPEKSFRDTFGSDFLTQLKSHFDDTMSPKEHYLCLLSNILLNNARPSGYWEVWEEEEDDEEEPDEPEIPCTDTINVPDPIEYVPDDIVNYLIAGERTILFSKVSSETSTSATSSRSGTPELQHAIVAADDSDLDYDSDVTVLSYNALTWGKTNSEEPSLHYIRACQARQYVPPRYSPLLIPTQPRISDGDAISLLMKECNYRPSVVVLRESWIAGHGYPTLAAKNCKEKLLVDFMSRATSLDSEYSHVRSSVDPVNVIVASQNPCLSSLSLSGSYTIGLTISYLHDLCLHPSTPGAKTLVRSLKKLKLSGFWHLNQELLQRRNRASKLAAVIGTLASLTDLTLAVSSGYESAGVEVDHKLLSQLKCLIDRSGFRSLTIQHLPMSVATCQELILTYIASSCSDEQSLIFDPSIKTETLHNHMEPKVVKPAENSCEYKSLRLCTPYADCLFLPILKHLPAVHFKTLEFDCGIIFYASQRSEPQRIPELYATLATHPDVRVQSLIVRNRSAPISSPVEKVGEMEGLLGNRFLRELTISDSQLPSYVPALTKGLLEQSNINVLRVLSLSMFDIYDVKSSVWTQQLTAAQRMAFFDAIFSLPRLDQLTLSLELRWSKSMNCVLYEMYLSWKQCSQEKHLKKLSLGMLWEPSKQLEKHLREMGAEFKSFGQNFFSLE